jgi:hypothetical protein
MFARRQRKRQITQAARQARPNYRARIEVLEDRSVPSTIALDFNSLPSAQGWTYIAGHPPNAPKELDVYSVDGTKLTQNTMGKGENYAAYEKHNVIDPTRPFTIEVTARVLESEPTPGGGSPSAFMVFGRTGTEDFGFGMNTTTIQAPFIGGLDYPIDGTVFHDYRIEAVPGRNVSIYVDNSLLVSARPPSLSHVNAISLGDNSGWENGHVDITSFKFTQADTDISLANAETWNLQDIQLKYAITGEAAQPFTISAYLSTDQKFDDEDSDFPDAKIPSELLRIENDPDLQPGEHNKTLRLLRKAPISASHRFIIVVANAEKEFPELDDDYKNNAWFAVPLIGLQGDIGWDGSSFDGSSDRQAALVGRFVKKIEPERSDPRYVALCRIDGDDPGLGDYDDQIHTCQTTEKWVGRFGYHARETTPELKNQDHLIQRTLKTPFENYAHLILADRQHYPANWDGLAYLGINEAYDSINQHEPKPPCYCSVHYEGRALDIQAIDRTDQVMTLLHARLVGLSFLAGFGYSWHEDDRHIHISHFGAGSSPGNLLGPPRGISEVAITAAETVSGMQLPNAAVLSDAFSAVPESNLPRVTQEHGPEFPVDLAGETDDPPSNGHGRRIDRLVESDWPMPVLDPLILEL